MLRPITNAATSPAPHVPTSVLVPPPGPRTVVLVVGPVTDGTASVLCDRVAAAIVGAGADVVTCDVSDVRATNVSTVDALARMQLIARREGGSIRLRRPSVMLRGLLNLTGLAEVIAAEQAAGNDPASGSSD